MEDKKKQKAPLGIRPDDYTEIKFREMVENENISQTKLFERIFWNYISESRKDKKEEAISFESEIGLIDKCLNDLLLHFKGIVDKSQNTVISLKDNIEQTEKNYINDIDTLNKRIEELENRNKELEQSNNVFNEVKEGLELKIKELTEGIDNRNNGISELLETIRDKDKSIKNLDIQLQNINKEYNRLDKENKRITEDISTMEVKIKGLEISNISLKETLDNLDKIKKIEVDSIEVRYGNKIKELENRLGDYESNKIKEFKGFEDRLKIEFEADKKLTVADMKLELVDVKGKYGELLKEYNELASEINRIKEVEDKNKNN